MKSFNFVGIPQGQSRFILGCKKGRARRPFFGFVAKF